MRAVIRVDASARMGSGHVMRCLTLADTLRRHGLSTLFVSRHLPQALHERILMSHHEVAMLASGTAESGDLPHSGWLGVEQEEDAAETLRALDGICDWIIVDHYALDARWERLLRKAASHIMVIDDLADRLHDCDLLLDQNLLRGMNERYAGKVGADCELLLGPRYALLQPPYAALHHEVAIRRQPIRNVLVYFGGAETSAITRAALEACLQLDVAGLCVEVVDSAAKPTPNLREQHAASGVRVHRGVPTLAPLMARADLAIGACGSTSWERLCLGLPSIAVTLAQNQREVASRLHELQLVRWLGHHDAVDARQLGQALRAVFDCDSFSDWSRRCLEVCDGGGTERVLAAMRKRMGSDARLFPASHSNGRRVR